MSADGTVEERHVLQQWNKPLYQCLGVHLKSRMATTCCIGGLV
jgi:hypothetical protein